MKRVVGTRNQEVTDAQGRRRFHGAFTGGFSAGYYNSVGSEEGWKPQTFSSSRNNRSSRVEQRPEDFMDEEDDPLLGKRLETSEQYDTLKTGYKRRLQQQQQHQPNHSGATSIPGFTLPDDWVLPVNDSIGVKLLKQMGWKEGHGIGQRVRRHKINEEEKDGSMHDAEEDKAQLQLQDDAGEEVYVPPRKVFDVQKVFPKPKLDWYGAGFDPYADAPEFSVYKQQQEKEKEGSYCKGVSFLDALNSSNGSNCVTNGYGLSALEENDDVDVYGTVSMAEFDRAIAPLGSKHNIQRIGSSVQSSHGQEKTSRSRALCSDGRSALPGFELAVSKEKAPKVVNMRLAVPPSYTACHRFDEDEGHGDAVTALYRKFNFLTDKSSNGTLVTVAQRGAVLKDKSTDKVRLGAGEVARSAGSVFDLLGEDQRAKLFDAAKQAKQGLLPSRIIPTGIAEEPAIPKDRQPLVCGNDGDQFRATISASIAKRFVSSKSPLDNGKSNIAANDVPHANVSRRSQGMWIPKSLLCKRFHVKCLGPTVSNGKDDENDKKLDLFDKELVPHLMEYAADRAAQKRSGVNLSETTKYSEGDKAEGDETVALPALPAVVKSSASLLQSIFEPSDESDLSRDSSEDGSDDDVSDIESKEMPSLSKQEFSSGGDAGEFMHYAAVGDQEESILSDDDASVLISDAPSGRVNEQVDRLKKRSHSVGVGRDAKREEKKEKRKHKKHKKHHKHRSSRDSKEKQKVARDRKSNKHRSSRHSKRSRSAIRSPSHRRSSVRRNE
ncbi:unnamed protein product [Peronospora belbahrii]|uniref:G-patch domain-containing protein n=1 Tax=Peronospora belbahrii TaxID=622444 RepID=A0ABN8DCN9_9STRA|nr:unnamed protein product [Peronospora belbahrii]